MSKHTPGPWRLEGTFIFDERGLQNEANARLIAAAPGLLEVCRNALVLVQMMDPASCTEADRSRLIMQLIGVIKKAEGAL